MALVAEICDLCNIGCGKIQCLRAIGEQEVGLDAQRYHVNVLYMKSLIHEVKTLLLDRRVCDRPFVIGSYNLQRLCSVNDVEWVVV